MSDDIRPELHKIGYGQAITPSLPPIAAAPSDTPEATSGGGMDEDYTYATAEVAAMDDDLLVSLFSDAAEIDERMENWRLLRAEIMKRLSSLASLRSENEALRKVAEAATILDDAMYDRNGPADKLDSLWYDLSAALSELRRIQDSGEPRG